MTDGSAKTQVTLNEDFEGSVVRGGTKVVFNENGTVDVFASVPVEVHLAANDTAPAKATPKIGDRMEDGTIYAGISPDTDKPMYATPADAPLTYTFNQAQEYATNLDANGHQDWRVPTKGELNVLFQNRAAIGGFNETGSDPAGWYWSSSQLLNSAWVQRFSGGHQDHDYRNFHSSLRCVR